jgi:hypothetical protein
MVGNCPRSGQGPTGRDTGGVSTEPQPVPRPAKPRLLQDGRDMFWSIVPLVVGCIALAGLVGMCSLRPAGTQQGSVPYFDAAAALRADAQALGFPIRLPRLPAGWQPNSGRRGDIENGRTDATTGQPLRAVTSTVGYISPTGMYLSLTQSNADEAKLVDSIHPSSKTVMYPTGVTAVGATKWVVYQGESGVEPVWTTRLSSPEGTAQLAITGAGTDQQFSTLAAATQSQPPLPARRSQAPR